MSTRPRPTTSRRCRSRPCGYARLRAPCPAASKSCGFTGHDVELEALRFRQVAPCGPESNNESLFCGFAGFAAGPQFYIHGRLYIHGRALLCVSKMRGGVVGASGLKPGRRLKAPVFRKAACSAGRSSMSSRIAAHLSENARNAGCFIEKRMKRIKMRKSKCFS